MTIKVGTFAERAAGIKEGIKNLERAIDRLEADEILAIRNDPQPSEKPVIMPGHNENSQPLMICPKAKECIKTEPRFCGHDSPHKIKSNCSNTAVNCPACVPYVPEKWVDVTYEHLREKLGKYKYGLR